jgi:hypothetical protein
MPHRLDDRQVHQPDFLEDNPVTQIAEDRLFRRFLLAPPPCDQKVGERVSAQLPFQHFARPGCREASFFYC